jgi:hypothetical protein
MELSPHLGAAHWGFSLWMAGPRTSCGRTGTHLALWATVLDWSQTHQFGLLPLLACAPSTCHACYVLQSHFACVHCLLMGAHMQHSSSCVHHAGATPDSPALLTWPGVLLASPGRLSRACMRPSCNASAACLPACLPRGTGHSCTCVSARMPLCCTHRTGIMCAAAVATPILGSTEACVRTGVWWCTVWSSFENLLRELHGFPAVCLARHRSSLCWVACKLGLLWG